VPAVCVLMFDQIKKMFMYYLQDSYK